MKKTIIAALILITAAFADIKLDFYVSTSRLGCDVVHWAEDTYEGGVHYKRYARVACKDAQRMPVNMVGLKFIDITGNLSGQYIYIYGEQ